MSVRKQATTLPPPTNSDIVLYTEIAQQTKPVRPQSCYGFHFDRWRDRDRPNVPEHVAHCSVAPRDKVEFMRLGGRRQVSTPQWMSCSTFPSSAPLAQAARDRSPSSDRSQRVRAPATEAGLLVQRCRWISKSCKQSRCKVTGHVTFSKLWLNSEPRAKVNDSRAKGHMTSAKLWLNL